MASGAVACRRGGCEAACREAWARYQRYDSSRGLAVAWVIQGAVSAAMECSRELGRGE